MPTYSYNALTMQGQSTRGSLVADNRNAALERVAALGLTPVSLEDSSTTPVQEEAAAADLRRRVPPAQVEAFTRELANLLAAGVPLGRALHVLRREATHPAAKAQWNAVHDDVVGGQPLADALARWPQSFSNVAVAMIRAGEAGGFLDVVLNQIADFRTRETELKGKVQAALVYPCVLVLLATAVVIFLLTFFIPRFTGIFADFGAALPALTRYIVAASKFLMRDGVYLAIGAAVGIWALRRWLRTEAGQRAFEKASLATPGVGPILARLALVRFTRMLGTLLSAGVPMVAALRVAREAIGYQTLVDAVTAAIEEVKRGSSLSHGLGQCPQLFPPSVVEMVAVAEESARLDKELLRLAQTYEGSLDRQLRMLVSLAEPLLLFLVAALIGTIVVGMLLPIFNLQELIK